MLSKEVSSTILKVFFIIEGFRTIVFIFIVISQDTWRNRYKRSFPKLLRRQSGDPHGLNKRRSSKFREGSGVWQTPEEGRRTYQPKRCGNNKTEDNSPKTLDDKKKSSSFVSEI